MSWTGRGRNLSDRRIWIDPTHRIVMVVRCTHEQTDTWRWWVRLERSVSGKVEEIEKKEDKRVGRDVAKKAAETAVIEILAKHAPASQKLVRLRSKP